MYSSTTCLCVSCFSSKKEWLWQYRVSTVTSNGFFLCAKHRTEFTIKNSVQTPNGLGTPLREEAWALERSPRAHPRHSPARLEHHVNSDTQVFGLCISKGIEGIRVMRAQNKQAPRAELYELNIKQGHVLASVQPPLFHWQQSTLPQWKSSQRTGAGRRIWGHALLPPAACRGWGWPTRRGLRDQKPRSVSCLICFLPPHLSLPVLLRNGHTGSVSSWWKGTGWFTLVLGEQTGPESAVDTKDIHTPRCCRVSCACIPPYHHLQEPQPAASKAIFSSCLAITLSLPVPSFLLVPTALGGFLTGSAQHSQLRLIAALFLVNGMQEGKEGRSCRDKPSVPLLEGTRDNPFCPYRTEESGLLLGPSSSHSSVL